MLLNLSIFKKNQMPILLVIFVVKLVKIKSHEKIIFINRIITGALYTRQ